MLFLFFLTNLVLLQVAKSAEAVKKVAAVPGASRTGFTRKLQDNQSEPVCTKEVECADGFRTICVETPHCRCGFFHDELDNRPCTVYDNVQYYEHQDVCKIKRCVQVFSRPIDVPVVYRILAVPATNPIAVPEIFP